MRISNGIQNRNRRMRNRTYGGVRGRKTKVGRKLLRFPPTQLVAMLKLGREIMESKIDEKLVHTVDIPDYREAAKLPADVEQNLSQFTGMLADNLYADKNMAKNLLDGVEAYTKP